MRGGQECSHLKLSLFFMKCEVKPLLEGEKVEGRAQASEGSGEDVEPPWEVRETATEAEVFWMSNRRFQPNKQPEW